MTGAGLEIKELACKYGKMTVLEAIALSIEKSEFIALIGPNGSGKTTLLKAISKTIEPADGCVLLDDQNIASLNKMELARRMAIVPQETFITFNFNALQVVLMGRTPHMKRWQLENESDLEIARKAMEMTDTWQFANKSILEMSGGEKQRVIIAQALTQQPKILLLDEPTLHLDLNHQLEIMELLKSLNENGLTIAVVLHDLNLAANYAKTVAIVSKKKIDYIGKPHEVLTADNIKRIFKTDVIVRTHPVTGKPYVLMLPKSQDLKKQTIFKEKNG